MKLAALLASLVVASSSAAIAVAACGYNVSFSSYGAACSASGAPDSTLTGGFDGTNTCHVAVKFDVPGFCCNVFVNAQLLVIGTSPANIPAPGGCKLLVTPTVILPLTPTTGTTVIEGDIPPSPALVGSVYLQGIVGRFTTISFSQDYDFTAGLQILIGP